MKRKIDSGAAGRHLLTGPFINYSPGAVMVPICTNYPPNPRIGAAKVASKHGEAGWVRRKRPVH